MQTDKGHIEIAKSLMKEIQYDNGAVNRWNDETYPEKWVNKIAIAAGVFFEANPDRLTDEDIFEIACGGMEDSEETYGKLTGWKGLNDVLNEYFDNM